MASFDYDVAIVGSGFGGSVAALRAAEKGYRGAGSDVFALLGTHHQHGEQKHPFTSWLKELINIRPRAST
jgi:cholesterol oxidase